MPKKITETHGDGITKRTVRKTSYRFDSQEDNEELVPKLEQMFDNIKQPWRGNQEWVDEIRARAAELEVKAPKWEDDPAGHNKYFAKRKTEAGIFG